MPKKTPTKAQFGGRITVKDETPRPLTARERKEARKRLMIVAVAATVVIVTVTALVLPLLAR